MAATVTFQSSSLMTPELEILLKEDFVIERFRYELLDSDNVSKGFLNCVIDGGSMANNYLADIKRTCSFKVAETGNFDDILFNSDRVKIYYEIYDSLADNWLSFPRGVFTLTSASRVSTQGIVTRDVQGYDLTQILKKRKHTERFVVPVDSDPVAVAVQLIHAAGLESDIDPNGNTDPLESTADLTKAERTYDPGSEFIYTINDLLGMVGYRSVWSDDNGVICSYAYVPPVDRNDDNVYVTDSLSIVDQDASQTIDTSEVPNIVQIVVSQTDRPVIVGLARNDNPDSETSTINSPEFLISYTDNEDVTTQAQADAKAYRLLTEASQIFENVEIETSIVPTHGENSVIGLVHTGLGISASYSEMSWSMTLSPGAKMKHSMRRTVRV